MEGAGTCWDIVWKSRQTVLKNRTPATAVGVSHNESVHHHLIIVTSVRDIAIRVSVYMSVCPFALCVSQTRHVHVSRNLLHMLYLRSWLSAVRCVLPFLWMTSCFHIMGPVGQNQALRYVLSSSPNGRTGINIVQRIQLLLSLVGLQTEAVTWWIIMEAQNQF